MAKRRRVYLAGDARQPHIKRALAELLPWLERHATVVGLCDDPAQPLAPRRADLLLVLGGDGAILSAAARLNGRDVPLIGLHLGHFGFLAELDPRTCREQLERIFRGEGRIVERLMLHCEVWRAGKRVHSDRALNDAVVTARSWSRMVRLELLVDGERVATYRADGLILATPLGSTAHSLAAGGPVVEPDASSILVTPLAAHSLGTRPLVLSASRRLIVRSVDERRAGAALTLDGQRPVKLLPRDEVRVGRAREPLRLLTVVERSFFATLREKFQWNGEAS